MKIYAPNEQYTGVSASVVFVNGVGQTEDPARIEWFEAHGYRVEKSAPGESKAPPDNPPQAPLENPPRPPKSLFKR